MIPRYEIRYGSSEFYAALGALLTSDPTELSPELFGIPGHFQVVPCLRGREALFVLLKSLGFPQGTGIGVPLFVCSCVPRTISEAGFTPVFIDTCLDDFGPDLADLARKSHLIGAVLVVYTLGRPIDLEAVHDIVPDTVLIEDCAHAMGSTYRGRMLGSLGVASFFSFGFFKPVSAGGGGAIIVHDEQVATRARRLLKTSQPPTLYSQVRHSLSSLAKGTMFRNPAYSILTFIRAGKTEEHQHTVDDSRCISGPLPMRTVDHAVIKQYLQSAASDHEDTHDLWTDLRSRIPDGWHIPPEPTYGTWNHFMFAIRSPSADRCGLAVDRLRTAGISVARLFPNCRAEMEPLGYREGCPSSELLSSLAFTIPIHRGLSPSQKSTILRIVPDALRAV